MSPRAAPVRAFLVEDEPHARASLREYAAGVEWLTLVGEAGDGLEAVGRIDELQPDLVFLDVGLAEISGLEVVQRLRHQPEIVFTTAHDRFALAAFEIGALDYLLKPFGRQRFQTMLERVHRRLLREGVPAAERARSVFGSPLRRLFARTRDGIVPIDVRTIQHLQANGDYVEVFCAAGRYLLHTGLAELAERLDPELFLQVHRSHVVNLEAVELLRPFDDRRLVVQLRGGQTIVASRTDHRRQPDGIRAAPPPGPLTPFDPRRRPSGDPAASPSIRRASKRAAGAKIPSTPQKGARQRGLRCDQVSVRCS